MSLSHLFVRQDIMPASVFLEQFDQIARNTSCRHYLDMSMHKRIRP